jgi:rRNA maturation protein Nop10
VSTDPKILTLDIETSPSVAHVWGLFKQTVSLSQLQEATKLISFAAKWRGQKPVLFYSDFHDGHEVMVQRAHDLIDQADVVVHFNGKTFDMPHLRREFIMAELPPPSPVKEVDLLQVVKANFRFVSNKLQHVSTQLGLAGKVSHTGHDLWVRCMAGDPKAWALMRKYNKGDVVLTEQVYDRLLPWIGSHPHVGLYVMEGDRCQRCGSDQLIKRGQAYTPLGVFQQYRCEECKSWSRGGKRLAGVDIRGVQ